MTNIVKASNHELVVSIKDISEFSGTKYESVRSLVRNNTSDFESLGVTLPKNVDFKSTLFNEPQATFLLTLMQNTPKVKEFKLNLVKQFYSMKNSLCEINKQENDRLTSRVNELENGRVYRDGTVALRTYIKSRGKFIKEADAWDHLVDNGHIANTQRTTIHRTLINTSIGMQEQNKVPLFIPSELDDIFSALPQ